MNFLKVLLASCLGTLLALVVLFLVAAGFIGKAISDTDDTVRIGSNSVLRLDLPAVMPELTGNMQSGNLSLDNSEELGLYDVMRSIRRAAEDNNIKGIYLNQGFFNAQPATVRQLRQELLAFRETGKFVVAFSPNYGQAGYYLASAADAVYVGPMGILDFRGLGAEIPFMKDMLDRIGVNMEVFYVGDYKSATEPLRYTEMSRENREQTKIFLENLFDLIVDDIAVSRNLSPAGVRGMAANITGWREQELLSSGLIDGFMHRSEVEAEIRSRLGLEENRNINTVGLSDYFEARLNKQLGGHDQVRVIVAEGTIVDGSGDYGSIGDRKYVELIQDARRDDLVKAVVLRINSGGGSASSSENIWAAVEDLKAAGKPVVVSMSDVAASGGYYIAAGADSIFAQPSTITGSIGVFNVFPDATGLMKEHIGINFDTVNTAPYANAFSPFQGLSDTERTLLTQRAQIIYDQFLERVSTGRDIPMDRMRQIARGRVYSGVDALDLGLVDRLAGLDEAIASAASLAGLDNYSMGFYPRVTPPLERFVNDLMGLSDSDGGFNVNLVREQLGEQAYQHFELMRDLTQMQGVQARMPIVVKF
ncbi:MAG: signal peptide peptidase SppA [Bacteroidota bacterium]